MIFTEFEVGVMPDMNDKLLKRSEYFKQTIRDTNLPRNQIAALSGISNTYIRDLELGTFINISRERLIRLAICMNLTLTETDEMLVYFDRTSLSEEDIPIYIGVASQIKPSSVMHPILNIITYEILMLSSEMIEGSKLMMGSHLTAVLQVDRHRSHKTRSTGESHPLFFPLYEEIGKERRRQFTSKILNHKMEHFIDVAGLDKYMKDVPDPTEKDFRQKHLETIIWYLKNYPNFNYYITPRTSGFSFLLKQCEKKSERLFFSSHCAHLEPGLPKSKIFGFYTSNKMVISQFKMESESARSHVLEEYLDRAKLLSFLESFLQA